MSVREREAAWYRGSLARMPPNSAYHLRELALARSPNDPRRVVPEIPPGCKRILDIGCGAGQTLIVCAPTAPTDCRLFGIDFEFAAVRLGKQLEVPASLSCASGEALPFRSGSFDFVYSRVALPYMNIATAAAEIGRVLQPGGTIWLTLHPLSMLSWRKALGSPRRTVFEIYRLVNTAALHFLGRQFRYPLRRSRTESYQTPAGMRRILEAVGFELVRVAMNHHFIVTARKRR